MEFLILSGSRWLETSLFVSGKHYYSRVKLCIRPIPGNNLVPNLPFSQLLKIAIQNQVVHRAMEGLERGFHTHVLGKTLSYLGL